MRVVLAIGAHPDDLELSCGGTLAAHARTGDVVHMLVMTGGQNGPGDVSARFDEAHAAARVLGARLHWGGLADGRVEADTSSIGIIERVMQQIQPDVIYVHHTEDSHQDHRAVAAATLSAARRHSCVLHYQSPSSLNFTPGMYVDISEQLDTKMEALECHRTQVELSAMVEPDVVVATARHYGAMARIPFAEAFRATRYVWNLNPRRNVTVAQAATPVEIDLRPTTPSVTTRYPG